MCEKGSINKGNYFRLQPDFSRFNFTILALLHGCFAGPLSAWSYIV